VPVDWEDNEQRPPPHADLSSDAAGEAIPAAPSTFAVPIGTLKAYRSVRVNVDNFGAKDCDVTAWWSMDGSGAGIGTSETQTVAAGAVSALLFRSQGHNLDQVEFSGVGGATTINYEIAGSNLDPLPPSAAGDVPWIRRRKLAMADQAFDTGVEPTLTWNATHNDYPAVFAAGALGAQVLIDGLYSIVCRLFLNGVVGNFPAELYLNNIDSDAFGRYPSVTLFPLYSAMLQGSTIARLVAGSDIYVTCRQESGSMWSIEGNDGCYLELRRLGDVTTVDTFG
jgi:hypothetical protein